MDCFTAEFFKFFWVDLGKFILKSVNYAYKNGVLSVTKNQGVITCIPKPNKPRHFLNQRTNGPVKAHLIFLPSKAQNIQNLENIRQRNDHDLQYSHTFIISIICLILPTFRSRAAIVSEKSTVSLSPIEEPK